MPELKGHVTSVKVEQFIHELAQLDENTGETQEAKMDIVAESPMLRAMLDVRCYLSTLKRQWRSARAHEIETSALRDTFRWQTLYKFDVVCSSREHVRIRRPGIPGLLRFDRQKGTR